MNSLTAYHHRRYAEALVELERQRTKQAVTQLAREHPVATVAVVGVAALLVVGWLMRD